MVLFSIVPSGSSVVLSSVRPPPSASPRRPPALLSTPCSLSPPPARPFSLYPLFTPSPLARPFLLLPPFFPLSPRPSLRLPSAASSCPSFSFCALSEQTPPAGVDSLFGLLPAFPSPAALRLSALLLRPILVLHSPVGTALWTRMILRDANLCAPRTLQALSNPRPEVALFFPVLSPPPLRELAWCDAVFSSRCPTARDFFKVSRAKPLWSFPHPLGVFPCARVVFPPAPTAKTSSRGLGVGSRGPLRSRRPHHSRHLPHTDSSRATRTQPYRRSLLPRLVFCSLFVLCVFCSFASRQAPLPLFLSCCCCFSFFLFSPYARAAFRSSNSTLQPARSPSLPAPCT